ncbi:hypothetical protein VNO78_07636 [Psophocarpus tetragonolobus]|uniref:Uncharacterized protein n=1 Tax=Psophocarpus tetragonolobus TaxID=3891 RepID=A0AAN9SUY6_PSOTE
MEEHMFMLMDEQHYYSDDDHRSEEDLELCWDDNCDSHHSPDMNLYWESQVALLQEILERHHLSGSKLRREADGIIKEVKGSDFCSCLKPNFWECSTCLRRQVVDELSQRGFSTNLCISKWGTTKKFPGGCHEYIEVIANTSTRKRQIHFLVELEFREQFQIARASESYQKLVSCLPEIYIGKPEYITAIVRVMCNAAKKSMKEKKMHVGPWRKRSFMQMKWSGLNQTCNSNKLSVQTYAHAQPNEPYLRISGVPMIVTSN